MDVSVSLGTRSGAQTGAMGPAAIASQNHAFSDLLLLRVTRGGVASCQLDLP